MDESNLKLEESERKRKCKEEELLDLTEHIDDLKASNEYLSDYKMKLETDLNLISADFEDQSNVLRTVDEKHIQVIQEVSKLEEELMNEQEKCQMEMNQRKAAESKTKEVQVRAENAELALAQGWRKLVERLESKVRYLEEELETEKRNSRDAIKISRQLERNCKDIEYQCQEEKRNYERLEDMVGKLQDKTKMYKRMADNAEEMASSNLAKLRKAQADAEVNERRADLSEQEMERRKQKTLVQILSS